MVHTPIDPMHLPTINQSPAEIAEMEAMIENGTLPKDFIKRHIDAVDANVFGVDAPKDRQGFRLEQGVGSSGNMTQQSIDAYVKTQTERRIGGPEPDFDKHVARMKAELAKTQEKKDAQAGGFRYGRK